MSKHHQLRGRASLALWVPLVAIVLSSLVAALDLPPALKRRPPGPTSAVLRALESAGSAMQGGAAVSNNPRQIVEEAQRRAESKSQRYEGSLQVIDSRGKIADKRWEFMRLGSHGHSRAVLRFTAPAEVKGVALLVINHPDRASDQWMWTPALARERRIALQDRATRFFGTDFSFEDLEERDVAQYDYELLGEQVIDGARAWRIQSKPARQRVSQYTRSELWVRQDTFAFAQIESYIKDQLVRRLQYSDFANVQNVWTARHMAMTDLRRKSRTVLKLDKLQYNVPMNEDVFTLQAIRNQ